jgi:hypothetical protein
MTEAKTKQLIFTESELCEKLGVAKTTLNRWRLQGKAPPSSKKGRTRFYWGIEDWIMESDQPVLSSQSPVAKPAVCRVEAVRPQRQTASVVTMPSKRHHSNHGHARRSTHSQEEAEPAHACPKCLSTGKPFLSKLTFWDLPGLLLGIKPLRCQRCMHRFHGRLKSVPTAKAPKADRIGIIPLPSFGWLVRKRNVEDLTRLKTAA